MDISRRAYYTSLRDDWLKEPTLQVEDWQVEDYREMPYSVLFERLRGKLPEIDRVSFLALALDYDTPEELSDALAQLLPLIAAERDMVYLVIFELWRRLVTDKPCLSIFCEELDHQISLYDRGEVDNSQEVEDLMANLQAILDENTDQSGAASEVYQYIAGAVAHDLSGFIVDYIGDQCDAGNVGYATELVEGFEDYIVDDPWFTLMKAKVASYHDMREAVRLLQDIIEGEAQEEDLDYVLELLSLLAVVGDDVLFRQGFDRALTLLDSEEDFQDLLDICIDYHTRRDNDGYVEALQQLSTDLHGVTPSAPAEKGKAALQRLKAIIDQ